MTPKEMYEFYYKKPREEALQTFMKDKEAVSALKLLIEKGYSSPTVSDAYSLVVIEENEGGMSSRNNFCKAGYTVYRIDLNKSEIAAIDMVLSAATKDDFGSEENNDVIRSLADTFSRYRREIE